MTTFNRSANRLPHAAQLGRRLIVLLLAVTAAVLTVTAGPMLTGLLTAAALVTWLGAYTSAGIGS